MTWRDDAPDALLEMEFGGGSVQDNLERAIAAGHLTENVDGTLSFARHPRREHAWVMIPNADYDLPCSFRKELFASVYAQVQVPYGCSSRYKIKVRPRTLAELVADWHVALSIACYSKWGIDLDNPHSQNVYAEYFYTDGLEAARVLYAHVRGATDANPRLGPDVPIAIKRGCSDYEAAVGPSDQYHFTPEMAELEAWLWSQFRACARKDPRTLPPLDIWVATAFKVGDDSYLTFTGGKRLHNPTVTYAPLGPQG